MPSTIRTFRASQEPLAMACPGSTRTAGEVLIDTANDAADVGSAVHEAAACIVQGQEPPAAEDLLARYGLGPEHRTDVEVCIAYARRYWSENGSLFEAASTEVDLKATDDRGIAYTGHADVLAVNADGPHVLIRVLDWKTTRLDASYRPQMMRYLWLAWDRLQEPNARYQYTVVYLRDQTQEVSAVMSEKDLLEYQWEFQRRVIDAPEDSYTVGTHCTYCHRLASCPAHSAMVRKTVADLVAETGTRQDGGPIVPAALVEMYERVGLVAKLCERFQAYAKAACIQAGGRIVSGGSMDLAIVTSHEEAIDPLAAWPILEAHLTQEELAPAVKIGKTALLDAVAARAPRGDKGKAKARFMDELRAAGAVNEKTKESLRVVRSLEDTKALTEEGASSNV